MIRKFLIALFVLSISSSSFVFADDFHKNYRPLPSNYLSKLRFEDANRIPIKIKPMGSYSTKKNLEEGQKLVFLTVEDTVLQHNKVLPVNSRILGVVETISPNETKGIPANLIVGNFKIEYMSNLKIEGTIKKQGANRSLWVQPLLPILFAIKGGHAKINSDENFVVYYTPKAF